MLEEKFKDFFAGKKILVTGCAGTVGRALISHLLACEPKELKIMDNNETEIFFMLERFRDTPQVNCILGDIRDRHKLEDILWGMDIVFHTAAFKHVIVGEYNPFDVVQNNVLGIQNLIQAALRCDVERVIFTSSDKAVNPTNVMGATKLLGEKLITAANSYRDGYRTIFASTRFGNVIGSRGSVVPVFADQIRKGGPVTLTDRQMTRFIMTVEEAAGLVAKAAVLAKGGEVFVTKMPVIRITDLAEVMIAELAPRYGHKPESIEIIEVGSKPGEKLYEELMNAEEIRRAVELEDMFVILPAFRNVYRQVDYTYPGVLSAKVERPYISANEKPLDKEELRHYLRKNLILEGDNG